MKFKVASIQMESPMGEIDANCDRAQTMIRAAASMGAKVVVTPECSLSGYCSDDIHRVWCSPQHRVERPQSAVDVNQIARRIPGKDTEHFASLAKELGIYAAVGLVELADDGAFYNTNVLLSPNGEIVLKYRKIHPWPPAEQSWAADGNLGVPVVQTEYGKLACGICFDIRFEVPQLAAKQGGDLFLYSAAWTDDTEADARRFVRSDLPAIARQNQMAIVYSNRNVKQKQWWTGSGRSAIYASDGSILAQSEKELEEDIILAEIEI
jgi:predicted amidohydrolase